MKINKKKLIKSLEIFAILFLIILLYFNGYEAKQTNIIVILSFIINGIVIVFNIVLDQSDYSLNKTFWYFNFFFFFIAPLFQYLSSYEMWNFYISDGLYLKTNLYIVLCYFIYSLSMFFLSKKDKKKKENNIIKDDIINSNMIDNQLKELDYIYSSNIMIVLLVMSLFSFAFLVLNISFKGLFIRDLNNISIGDNTTSVILENFFRSIPVYSIVYSIYYYKKKKRGIIFIIIELTILIMTNFPTSITRYWVGLVYIGMILIMFGNKLKDRKFDIILIFIFAVIFPIFQLFKWYSLSDLLNGASISQRLFDVYNSVDFDAYSIFCRTIDYVLKNGTELGHQLLASLFFIIPRAVWITKPYPTGQFIAMSGNQYFTNISCPLYAEGYVDFGIIGSLMYTVIISYLIYRADLLYWNNRKNKNDVIIKDYYYPFLFGVLIFMLRGSLQPVVVYSFTFFIFAFIIKKLCFRKRKLK